MATNAVHRLRKRARARSCGLGHASGSSRSRKCGRASRVAILHHKVAQCRAMAIHAEREHGAPGDLERHPLHHLAQVDRPRRWSRELGDRLVSGRDHVRDQRRDGARREGRRQGSALVFPGATLRDQKPLAEHRTQHPNARRGARVILVIVDQHMPDRIRRVEDEAAAAEEAALDDVLLIGALAPRSRSRFAASPPSARARSCRRTRAAGSAAPAAGASTGTSRLRRCSRGGLARKSTTASS